ncbi:MAG: hypothetical protein ABJF67_09545 [Aurantimonas coralicida]|jgi:hypothetical protein|uniref:Uncharacterized protein n=1 Tax=Aurantimonas manganoxydans (strain ATCC BAA-1229 / DSM 21871 / SI85-9A1) TaxID=287752 RepID=Q1YGE4_AURMS|nr:MULTISPECIES: hypothetical protein [Aurantimonas]MAP18323.1 hypothetical protein [Aurantimonas sp.]MCW7542796.1 hypothetical protein [Aurantimonas litoralis]EAS49281.1 hypothetical protein SI859A1_02882 [Aurantimonas manganoxydans SI85-9A1]MAY29915.1 hypothetical protein [Aurantimonas sp.]MBC6717108.1 hypothetical protein [Aurantimonas sp. DM33-3]|tara:strand:- start:114 stop:464 length:351 start_codon:yes stop_codon:yes gene_type:complete
MVSPRSDSIPNEANCPVHLEILALLLRSDDATKQALIREIPGPTRARLAFFCYNRVHLRGLAFQITALCELADLRTIAGAKGDLLYSQATEQGLFEDGEGGPRRHKGVTLARTARG